MDELDALWAFLVAGGVSFLLTPLAAGLARRLGVVHLPRQRDLHDRPTPGLGGLAILVAVVVSAVAFLPNDQETRGIIGGGGALPPVWAAPRQRAERAAPPGQPFGHVPTAAVPPPPRGPAGAQA